MKENIGHFTAGEFAKLHHINKRTLHYYDDIKLFSPKFKGENGYRYYTFEQSMDLENILALREMEMSIEEIKSYTENPNSTDFLNIAEKKIEEINKQITRLKKLKTLFTEKKEMLELSKKIYDGKIELVYLKEEYLLTTSLSISFEDNINLLENSLPIMEHLRESSALCTYKKSCGSYISLEKIKKEDFEEYDGIFSVIDKKSKNLYLKKEGLYLRAFSIGSWDKIPLLYKKILEFAKEKNLILGDHAFERGINEFAISSIDDYITEIEIPCQNQL